MPETDKTQLFRLIDLTRLNDDDNDTTITELCQQASSPLGKVAAICIYPTFISLAKHLQPTINVATVCNFPSGNQSLELTLKEIQQAIELGADEIDLVFPYQAFLKGDTNYCERFIQQCRLATLKPLKIILETGAFPNQIQIAAATKVAINSGADFIKTSTGKIKLGASLEAAEAILTTIKQVNPNTGFKVSGGVATIEQARTYINLAKRLLGADYITPNHFRIGASRLVKQLL